jgi:hypothetical protein
MECPQVQCEVGSVLDLQEANGADEGIVDEAARESVMNQKLQGCGSVDKIYNDTGDIVRHNDLVELDASHMHGIPSNSTKNSPYDNNQSLIHGAESTQLVLKDDTHRKRLMLEKCKVIHKLQALGYDPFTGIYVAHRPLLMEYKERVIRRLEELGYNAFSGMYAAHRGKLMEEKEKAINRLHQLGFDPFRGIIRNKKN